VLADVAREAANQVVDRLRDLGVHHEGSIHFEPVRAWLSQSGFDAERRAPGSSADSVVWTDVVQRAYEESELNWTYLSFLTLATLIATVAIVLDSQVLVIGAIVLTTLAVLLARAVGWVVLDDVVGPRPDTGFIYSPDRWSVIVALVAAAAGVLSLTSAKVGGSVLRPARPAVVVT